MYPGMQYMTLLEFILYKQEVVSQIDIFVENKLELYNEALTKYIGSFEGGYNLYFKKIEQLDADRETIIERLNAYEKDMEMNWQNRPHGHPVIHVPIFQIYNRPSYCYYRKSYQHIVNLVWPQLDTHVSYTTSERLNNFMTWPRQLTMVSFKSLDHLNKFNYYWNNPDSELWDMTMHAIIQCSNGVIAAKDAEIWEIGSCIETEDFVVFRKGDEWGADVASELYKFMSMCNNHSIQMKIESGLAYTLHDSFPDHNSFITTIHVYPHMYLFYRTTWTSNKRTNILRLDKPKYYKEFGGAFPVDGIIFKNKNIKLGFSLRSLYERISTLKSIIFHVDFSHIVTREPLEEILQMHQEGYDICVHVDDYTNCAFLDEYDFANEIELISKCLNIKNKLSISTILLYKMSSLVERLDTSQFNLSNISHLNIEKDLRGHQADFAIIPKFMPNIEKVQLDFGEGQYYQRYSQTECRNFFANMSKLTKLKTVYLNSANPTGWFVDMCNNFCASNPHVAVEFTEFCYGNLE